MKKRHDPFRTLSSSMQRQKLKKTMKMMVKLQKKQRQCQDKASRPMPKSSPSLKWNFALLVEEVPLQEVWWA